MAERGGRKQVAIVPVVSVKDRGNFTKKIALAHRKDKKL